MQAGDAAIVDPLHVVAHRLRGHRGLLGHRLVGGARADHHDEPEALPRHRLHHHHPGRLVHPARQPARHQRRDDPGVGAGGQHVVVVLGQAGDDGHHLLRRLARAVHRLRHPVPQRAVQIDPCEAQVVVRHRPQPGERFVRGDGARGHRVQEGLYFFPVHRRVRSASLALPLRKPCRSSVT